MPLQNRVTPTGEIVAVSDRGMFMGNRGCLHGEHKNLRRQFTRSYKAWIICLTKFKGRKRELMTPKLYTELFFLDEATGLAAGHRPCGECRRACFRTFREAWLDGNSDVGIGPKPRITEIDKILHEERLTDSGEKRTFESTLGELPDGTFLKLPDADTPWLLWSGHLHHWTPGGYDGTERAEPGQIVEVLTPRSTVNALRAGYKPEVHPTAK